MFVLQFAVQKCLYLGGFWSDFEFLKTHMSPHVSWACPAMSWACPGHVLGMFKSCQRHPATRIWCIFFNFFQFFFSIFFNFFAKNQHFYVKFVTRPPMFRAFYKNFIHNFSDSGNRGTQRLAFDAFFYFFWFFFFFLLKINFFFGKLVKPCHVRPFYIDFTIGFSYFANKRPPNPSSTWNFDTAIYDWNMT